MIFFENVCLPKTVFFSFGFLMNDYAPFEGFEPLDDNLECPLLVSLGLFFSLVNQLKAYCKLVSLFLLLRTHGIGELLLVILTYWLTF